MSHDEKLVDAVEDAVAFPTLTQEVSTPGSGGNGLGVAASRSGFSPQRVISDGLRQVLGSRVNTNDVSGFLASIKKTFTLTQVEDHVEWTVNSQPWSVQADLGQVTGAQACLLDEAESTVQRIMKELPFLTPLRPDARAGDTSAILAIISQELPGLRDEMARIAGPRVQRVDSIFTSLLGPNPDPADPAKVGGHLGQLASRLGLARKWVNSVEDELMWTKGLMVTNQVMALYRFWTAQKQFFLRGSKAERYLGTVLSKVSQVLDSITDGVQNAYDAYNSLFIGPPERQTIELNFYGESSITLEELLTWLEQYAKYDCRQILAQGKDGVVAARVVISRLHYLMFLAVQQAKSGCGGYPRAFHALRGLRPMQEIRQYLGLLQCEMDEIRRRDVADTHTATERNQPLRLENVVSVLPIEFNDGTIRILVTAAGCNIQPGSQMRLISNSDPREGMDGIELRGDEFARIQNQRALAPLLARQGISVSSGITSEGKFLTALFDRPCPTSSYTLLVFTPEGQYAWLGEALSSEELTKAHVPKPRIDSVKVSRTGRTQHYKLKILGANFEPTVDCLFFPASPASQLVQIEASVKVLSTNQLEVTVPSHRSGCSSGPYTISVCNPAVILGKTCFLPSDPSPEFMLA